MKPLKDYLPELKKIEGFPIGEDEDILALSNPPYYTACPNPYIEDFIKEHGTPYDEETDNYHREPFVGDVSEGKGSAIYLAHGYHTKVPPKAIENYIKHYTNIGDIVLDGFCGSGMTGVAAQSLGRKAIISDLSTVATFIASNFNKAFSVTDFYQEAVEILNQVEKELGWLYQTKLDSGNIVKWNYILWSEVLECNYCQSDYVFWNQAVTEDKQISRSYNCPHCNAEIDKSSSSKKKIQTIDPYTNEKIETIQHVPVVINYKSLKRLLFKDFGEFDKALLQKIERTDIPFWFPKGELPNGDKTNDPKNNSGYKFIHQYYTKRNLYVISCILDKAKKSKCPNLIIFLLTSFLVKTGSSLHNVGMKKGKINLAGAMPNAIFIPSIFAERNIFTLARGKLKDLVKGFSERKSFSVGESIVHTNSVTQLNLPSNAVDYIFTDPPFGGNLMYSELNYMWESWLRIRTNNAKEAIINRAQNKKMDDYYILMKKAFDEYYRVLKPKRWITVEFHNSKSSVWNAIQEALTKAGFVVVQVTILDKKQGTYNQMTSAGAVKSDLVISAYKPSKKFAERFLSQAGENMEVDFVREFLHNLLKEPVMERTDKMLYNKMLSQYIIRGYEIRYNASSFYQMLGNYFVEEDGYWFNENQLSAYQGWKQKMQLEGMEEVQSGQRLLFVSDEKSALVWLYNFISIPKSLDDIHAAFRKIANITDDNLPELTELLSENFIFENGKHRRPTSDEEKSSINEKRERQLMREFESLLLEAQNSKKKIKQVRKEALSLGFVTCYREKRFVDILTLAKKLDKRILENNAELNDYVEIAEIKTEGL